MKPPILTPYHYDKEIAIQISGLTLDSDVEDDCEFEHSPLSGRFSVDGIAVEVEIFRVSGVNDHWRLEVVSEYGRCTRWHTQFDTEEEAYQAFLRVVEADGLSFFDRVEPGTCH